MKKIILLFIFCIAFCSCQKVETTPSSGTEIAVQVTQGTWVVNSFIDSQKRDRTTKYGTYSFVFSANASLKIIGSGATFLGNWTTQKEGTKDRLVLTFATVNVPEEILDLNDNWYVMEKTDSSIKMQKINGYWETGTVQKEMSFKKL